MTIYIILSLICSFFIAISTTRTAIYDNSQSFSRKTNDKQYQRCESEFKVDKYEFKGKKWKP